VATWHRALLGPESRLRDLGAIDAHGAPSFAVAEPTAMRLADSLGLPALLADLPSHVRTITFVPDDVLVAFPFGALRWQGQPIVASRAVSIAFTVERTRSMRAKTVDRAVLVAVAAGAPAGDGFPPIPALPNTTIEVDTLAPWFVDHAQTVVRLDDTAVDKARVLSALPGATLVHFASHGIFRPEAPHLSGLLLTPHGTRTELLSLVELSKLDFAATRHVTLSSCWSADSFVLPGRRILSLPETLWRAGAESVLASLWPVDDRAAIAFMERFYAYLNEVSRAEALRRTQCDGLSGALGDDARDPFFWAGFTLYGETGRLF
jgi:CHAT domain-containing protein